MDIVLVGDVSSSVGSNVFFVADAFEAFVNRFKLNDDGIRIAILTFETDVHFYNELTSNKDTLNYSIKRIRQNGSGDLTYMSSAFVTAGNLLMNNGRDDAIKMIILVTDGAPTDELLSEKVAYELKTLVNIGICGVLVNNSSANISFLKKVSSEFCYVESSYDNLIEEFKKMDICL